ncbi:MAG: hypothetical protein GOMPHAMPRED_001067 [Gomphillus americanus]|uniref:Uncharacterized protein n=1 Tax=Gomphillus americanus TaxID=1940652 RepID=A0A8H3F1J9_9LECA|nr:MAG: hypothetical protein GOMPHAMPRED_001067 [Gomphillus americanus]
MASWEGWGPETIPDWRIAVGDQTDNEFLNHLGYLTLVQRMDSWPNESDMLVCHGTPVITYKDVRTERILADWPMSFAEFAYKSLEPVRSKLLISMNPKDMERSRDDYDLEWNSFTLLETCASSLLQFIIEHRRNTIMPMDGLQPLWEQLNSKPLVLHCSVDSLQALWRTRQKVCWGILDISEGRRAYSLIDEAESMKEQIAARKLFGLQVEELKPLDSSATMNEQLNTLYVQAELLGAREDKTQQ